MIGTATLPANYAAWNAHWGAPNGRARYRRLPLRKSRLVTKLLGPFAWQPNSNTRAFEYPWVHEQVNRLGSNLTIVDIGGSLSGIQFVFASEGHAVINVDPGLGAGGLGWDLDLLEHRRLSQAFGSRIEIIPTTIEKAKLKPASADVVLCVSAFEHFSQEDLHHAAQEISHLLKPGGRAIFTIDLFLDLFPFTDRTTNRWGHNLNVSKFLADAGLYLVDGREEELYGYPSFNTKEIQARLSDFLINPSGPCVCQCLIAGLR